MVPIALTIAGSDPGGGAGIQADLKTFHQLGVYGTAAITLITIQNTTRMTLMQTLDPELVAGQIDAVLEDLPPQAAKTGALGTAAIVEAVADRWQGRPCPLVVDPVMIGKHGAPLIDAGARVALASLLVSQAALVTPNLHEAAELAGMCVRDLDEMKEAALRIVRLGAKAVLIKGGHLEGRDFETETVDVLLLRGRFHGIPRPADRNSPHPRHRMHLFGGHHGVPGARRIDAGCGRARQAVHRRGNPDPSGTGSRVGPGKSLGRSGKPFAVNNRSL